MKPKLEPSPSPDEESPSPQSLAPQRPERKGRPRRTQPSLGDRVLINTLGDYNYPDVSVKAGVSPLNSDSEPDSPMETDHAASGPKSLQKKAQNVLNLVGAKNETETRSFAPLKQELGRREKPPKIKTQAPVPRSRDPSRVRLPSYAPNIGLTLV